MGTLQAAATGATFSTGATTTDAVAGALATFVGSYASKSAITDQITVLRTQYTKLDELINLNITTTTSTTPAVTIDAGLKPILEKTDTLDDAAIVAVAKLYYQMDASLNTVTTNTLAEFDTAVNTSLGAAATATPDATNISNIKGYFKDNAAVVGLLPTSITDHTATLDVLSKLVQVQSTTAGTTTSLNFPDDSTITAATTYKPAKDLLTNLKDVMAASTATASTATASTVVKKKDFTMAYLTLELSSSKITITPKEDATKFTTFIDATKQIPILLFDPERPKAARQGDIDKLVKEIGNEIKIRPDGYPVTEQLFKLSELREKVLGVK